MVIKNKSKKLWSIPVLDRLTFGEIPVIFLVIFLVIFVVTMVNSRSFHGHFFGHLYGQFPLILWSFLWSLCPNVNRSNTGILTTTRRLLSQFLRGRMRLYIRLRRSYRQSLHFRLPTFPSFTTRPRCCRGSTSTGVIY